MSVDIAELMALPPSEKLRIVELLCDDLVSDSAESPLPQWVIDEANRRLEEMKADPTARLTHEEVWRRIESRDA